MLRTFDRHASEAQRVRLDMHRQAVSIPFDLSGTIRPGWRLLSEIGEAGLDAIGNRIERQVRLIWIAPLDRPALKLRDIVEQQRLGSLPGAFSQARITLGKS